MTRTPDEIKRELDNPIHVHYHISDIEQRLTPLALHDLEFMHADALALIKQLEAQNAELLEEIERLQAERDAAVNDLKELADRHGACLGCKWFTGERCGDTEYKIICGFHDSKWEWRGVQKEERNE
ncbi:MAG: hypothetical protein PUD59_04910 [bacterium]|nr:hypothetical protein [bacterium]